jgi:hypothetical protein
MTHYGQLSDASVMAVNSFAAKAASKNRQDAPVILSGTIYLRQTVFLIARQPATLCYIDTR